MNTHPHPRVTTKVLHPPKGFCRTVFDKCLATIKVTLGSRRIHSCGCRQAFAEHVPMRHTFAALWILLSASRCLECCLPMSTFNYEHRLAQVGYLLILRFSPTS